MYGVRLDRLLYSPGVFQSVHASVLANVPQRHQVTVVSNSGDLAGGSCILFNPCNLSHLRTIAAGQHTSKHAIDQWFAGSLGAATPILRLSQFHEHRIMR